MEVKNVNEQEIIELIIRYFVLIFFIILVIFIIIFVFIAPKFSQFMTMMIKSILKIYYLK